MDKTRTNYSAKLNKLRSLIKRHAFGKLTEVSVGLFDHQIRVRAYSATHYGVQLTLTAVREFFASNPEMEPARLEFFVKGRLLVLHESLARSVAATGKIGRKRSSWDQISFDDTHHPESLFLRSSFPRSDTHRRVRDKTLSHSTS